MGVERNGPVRKMAFPVDGKLMGLRSDPPPALVHAPWVSSAETAADKAKLYDFEFRPEGSESDGGGSHLLRHVEAHVTKVKLQGEDRFSRAHVQAKYLALATELAEAKNRTALVEEARKETVADQARHRQIRRVEKRNSEARTRMIREGGTRTRQSVVATAFLRKRQPEQRYRSSSML